MSGTEAWLWRFDIIDNFLSVLVCVFFFPSIANQLDDFRVFLHRRQVSTSTMKLINCLLGSWWLKVGVVEDDEDHCDCAFCTSVSSSSSGSSSDSSSDGGSGSEEDEEFDGYEDEEDQDEEDQDEEDQDEEDSNDSSDDSE